MNEVEQLQAKIRELEGELAERNYEIRAAHSILDTINVRVPAKNERLDETKQQSMMDLPARIAASIITKVCPFQVDRKD